MLKGVFGGPCWGQFDLSMSLDQMHDKALAFFSPTLFWMGTSYPRDQCCSAQRNIFTQAGKKSCLASGKMDWECRLPEGLSRSAILTALPGALWTLLGWEWSPPPLLWCTLCQHKSYTLLPAEATPSVLLIKARVMYLIPRHFPFLVTSVPPLLTSET